jgi:phosphoglycolate phosphatase-like HAD superfamily hydrolase
MQIIEAILLEPVGCLAEFPAQPFNEIAAQCFGRKNKPSKSGSRSYWHLLNLMDAAAGHTLHQSAEALELQAVEQSSPYEDVIPALTELKAMGIRLFIASSLSNAAITSFVAKCRLQEFFSSIWTRDNAGGIKAAPLQSAIAAASLSPEHVMFLADTAEGLKTAQSVGLNSVLMMNDPDEARRLTTHEPAGGIVSLHELPDFIRLVATENAMIRK